MTKVYNTKATNRRKRGLLIKALRKCDGYMAKAAKMLGITYQCVYLWTRDDPIVKAAYEAINEEKLDDSEDRLIKCRNRNEAWAIKFHLSCKGRHRGYGERLEIAGDPTSPLVLRREEHLRKLSVEDLELIAETLSKVDGENRISESLRTGGGN